MHPRTFLRVRAEYIPTTKPSHLFSSPWVARPNAHVGSSAKGISSQSAMFYFDVYGKGRATFKKPGNEQGPRVLFTFNGKWRPAAEVVVTAWNFIDRVTGAGLQ